MKVSVDVGTPGKLLLIFPEALQTLRKLTVKVWVINQPESVNSSGG